MQNMKELTAKDTQQINGGGWSTPPGLSNIECKNGHLAVGNCRAKWGDISNGLVNQLVSCAVNGMYGGRCKQPGKFY
ncbi:hypothetical protein FQS96_14265 [Enterococcus faecalis]|uniref:hypothetical protein n=1 Tax=Enterococcus TaxID=1350 RepID=UPI001A96CD39|nr:hypothetical protein [Enterococcus faecalis]MBO1126602.1 hypothetical protein [Enterococcus faecalis]